MINSTFPVQRQNTRKKKTAIAYDLILQPKSRKLGYKQRNLEEPNCILKLWDWHEIDSWGVICRDYREGRKKRILLANWISNLSLEKDRSN